MSEVFLRIKKLLDEYELDYQEFHHSHVHRSQDAAQIRGTRYEEAAKALICKASDNIHDWFIMAVVPGPEKIDYAKLRKIICAKKLCLATPEEVLKKTGLTIGSIPPFGQLWHIPIYIEHSLLKNEFMVFSAGSHYYSIRIRTRDYLEAVPHAVEDFRKE
ncbi:MAG: YbaK/EbsC family protein [Nanoarchaeota archaeon]